MNKEASKAIIMALIYPGLGINDHLVLLDIVIFIRLALEQSFILIFVRFILSLNRFELFFFVFFLQATSEYNRLNAQHQRSCD